MPVTTLTETLSIAPLSWSQEELLADCTCSVQGCVVSVSASSLGEPVSYLSALHSSWLFALPAKCVEGANGPRNVQRRIVYIRKISAQVVLSQRERQPFTSLQHTTKYC